MNIDPEQHGRYIARQHHATRKIPSGIIITLVALAGLLATVLAFVLRTTWRILRPLVPVAYAAAVLFTIVFLASHPEPIIKLWKWLEHTTPMFQKSKL